MIAFSCKSCERKFLISDNLAGRKGLCPTCHEMFVVPSEDASTEESEPVPSKKTRAEVYVRREDIDREEDEEEPEEEPEQTEEQEEEEEAPPPPPRRRSTAQVPAVSAPMRHAPPPEEAQPQWKRAEEPPPSGVKRVLLTILFCVLAAGAGWFARGFHNPPSNTLPAPTPPPKYEDPAAKPPNPPPKREDPPVKPPTPPPKVEEPAVEPPKPPPKVEEPPVDPPKPPPKVEEPPVEPPKPPPKIEEPPVEPPKPPPKIEEPPVKPPKPPPKIEEPPIEPPPTPSTEAPPPPKQPPSTDASAALAEFDRRRSEIEDGQDATRHLEAMEALTGVLAEPHVVDRLGAILVDAKEPVQVRTKAAQMLGDGGGGARAQTLLDRGFQASVKEVRVARAAIYAMAKIGTAEGVKALEGMVRTRMKPSEDLQDNAHARHAITALGSLKRRDALEALMRLFESLDGARPRNRSEMSVDDWKVEGHIVTLQAAVLESLGRTAGQTLASYEDWGAWWAGNQGNFK